MSTLGLRNNNPLNIRFSPMNKWLGQTGSNKGFCVFDSMEHGFRAALVLLCNYQRKGYDTIRKIISHWAPPSENNTENYIAYCVSNLNNCSGLVSAGSYNCDKRLTTFDEIASLALFMSHFECGIFKPIPEVTDAFESALCKYKYPILCA